MPTSAFWLSHYPSGVPADIDLNSAPSAWALLEDAMHRYRDRPAFAMAGTVMRYSELDRLSQQFANYLSGELKLKPGSRVAIMLPNILQYPIALFGIWRTGLVAVNINPLYTPRELQHQLQDSGAEAIVVVENAAAVLEQSLSDTAVRHIVLAGIGDLLGFPKRQLVRWRLKKRIPPYQLPQAISWTRALALGDAHPARPVQLSHEDLALLQYTGGTTGVAKGAMLSQGNLLANILQAQAWTHGLLQPGEEVIITALPLYHIFSLLCNALLFSSLGGLNYLITNPRDLRGLVKTLRRSRFTAISGVNTLYNGLLNTPGFDRVDCSRLHLALAGGAALQRVVAERWQAVTGNTIAEAYGLTETSPLVCSSRWDHQLSFTGSVGLPVSSTEVAIWSEDDQPLPPGEIGELMIRGPQVTAGYWQRPEETAKALTSDGWLHTGDIARQDERGYVYIVDRKKDLILVSGFNVYPNEIEDVLMGHPEIAEVAAIGVPDPQTGEAVKIFVVAKNKSLTPDTLHAYCQTKLTNYKRPRHIELRASLPKSTVGKILRKDLRAAELAAREGRD